MVFCRPSRIFLIPVDILPESALPTRLAATEIPFVNDSESTLNADPKPNEQLQSHYLELLGRRSAKWASERAFVRKLGTGGQGCVMLSERRGAASFRIPVAMKFFSPAAFESSRSYEREMRRMAEVASLVARIQEDNLVTVHSFEVDEGIYMLEMEWVDGQDLLHMLRRESLDQIRRSVDSERRGWLDERIVTEGALNCRLRPGMAVAILRECLGGISALHRGGIVHCDLKPSNIMVKRTGQVKIIDIGSAFWVGRPPQGQPCTLEYAAPEVLTGYRATPQSDLASLGYMLIEMLSGARPFASLSFDQLVQTKMHLLEQLPRMLPLEEFQHSESLIRLLRGLVHPDPTKRFATAEDAHLSDEGVAGLLRNLVKSDLSVEYDVELRRWMSELEMDAGVQRPTAVSNGTTRIIPVAE